MSQAVHFAQLRNGIKFGDAALKGRIVSEEIFKLIPSSKNRLFVFNRGDTVSRRSPIKGVRPSPYTTLWS